ncbi:MAG TPA: imelysin family protein [Flavobacteriales bacterium]|nr:imelysin family protein [Flavobacteriales bacterium]
MEQKLLLISSLLLLAACKKDSAAPTTPTPEDFTTADVLNDFADHVAQDNYSDLAGLCNGLQERIAAFSTSLSDVDLALCQQQWRDTRQSWERSEALLFGPVATENIDPRIDTWPVNFVDLEAQLSSGHAFTAEYISSLEDALKGFHPIEYLLFGVNGEKTAAQFTAREVEYITALAADLADLTGSLDQRWDPATANNYTTAFTTAGSGSVEYPTQRAAFEELVNAMAGICDEVANGKMGEVLLAQDPTMEESPFAKNSLIDFTNNIRGVENVYLGRFGADGAGMENFVREHDLQLDNTIKQQLASSIAALGTITVPFGQAIIEQPVQVQQAIDAINSLAATLNDELMPLVQQHID